MKIVHRSAFTIAILCAFASAQSLRAAAPAKPAAATPGKPAASPAQPAITALLKEYKDKKGEGLREKSNYFQENKTEGITPDVIVAALEKPVSTDARTEAYVKWQLLSGVEAAFPEELKARVVRVYRNAPVPPNHPGGDHQRLDRELRRTIGINNADAEVPVNKELAEAIKKYREQIEPILAYRDELYSRMPSGFDKLAAGVSDVYDRASHGAPTTEFWKGVMGDIRAWALASTDSAHMRDMSAALTKLHAIVKDDKNKPYYRVMWIKEDNFKGLRWQGQGTIDQDRYMGELADWLAEHAKNPGAGGLTFKEDENKKMKK